MPSLLMAGEAPLPEEVLQKALSRPAVSYRARSLTTTWRDGRGRTEETMVYFRPPAMSRREFLGPDGAVTRVVVSDGEKETVWTPGQRKGFHGAAMKSVPKKVAPERELALLMANYTVDKAPEERLAGRRAWSVVMTPKTGGKPWQVYAVDLETGLLLRVRRYLPGTDSAEQTVVEDLELGQRMEDAMFQPDVPSENHGLDPSFSTPEEAAKEAGSDFRPPENLPGGFILESADSFEVEGERVLAVRYTDGMAVLSLYRTDRPAEFEDPESQSGILRSVHWSGDDSHFTLIGDLSDEALRNISLPLRSSR